MRSSVDALRRRRRWASFAAAASRRHCDIAATRGSAASSAVRRRGSVTMPPRGRRDPRKLPRRRTDPGPVPDGARRGKEAHAHEAVRDALFPTKPRSPRLGRRGPVERLRVARRHAALDRARGGRVDGRVERRGASEARRPQNAVGRGVARARRARRPIVRRPPRHRFSIAERRARGCLGRAVLAQAFERDVLLRILAAPLEPKRERPAPDRRAQPRQPCDDRRLLVRGDERRAEAVHGVGQAVVHRGVARRRGGVAAAASPRRGKLVRCYDASKCCFVVRRRRA